MCGKSQSMYQGGEVVLDLVAKDVLVVIGEQYWRTLITLCAVENEASTGGEGGRHLWSRLLLSNAWFAERRTSGELSFMLKATTKTKECAYFGPLQSNEPQVNL